MARSGCSEGIYADLTVDTTLEFDFLSHNRGKRIEFLSVGLGFYHGIYPAYLFPQISTQQLEVDVIIID